MIIRLEQVDELPDLPGNTLGFGPDGWQEGVVTEVKVRREGMILRQVLEHIQAQHGNLLGDGDLVIYHKGDAQEREVPGWIVFIPATLDM